MLLRYGFIISIPISSSEANEAIWLIHTFSMRGAYMQRGKRL
jgi:hypothetical protein